jgi:hypothetical protein
VFLWINAKVRWEKAEVLDAQRFGKHLRSFLASEPSGVLPRHPPALAVEVQALGHAVLPDLDAVWLLVVGIKE